MDNLKGLVPDDQLELWSEYLKTRDPALQMQIAERWVQLAWQRATQMQKYPPYNQWFSCIEEAASHAFEYLLLAIERFRPNGGAKFITFAYSYCTFGIRNGFRDEVQTVKWSQGRENMANDPETFARDHDFDVPDELADLLRRYVPVRYRRLYDDLYVKGLTLTEIAKKDGCRTQNVDQKRNTIIRYVRKAIQSENLVLV